MSMLAFFPWMSIQEEIRFGKFSLRPFLRGEAPFGAGSSDQKIADNILSAYITLGTGGPIASATILSIQGQASFLEYSDEERDELFLVSEIIAFCGLSEREFFGHSYANRDAISFIIQAFRGIGDEGVAIRSRRRDGTASDYHDAASYRVPRPFHVSVRDPAWIDVPLLKAIVEAMRLDSWEDLEDCIFGFNIANTDSPTVREQSEVVMMAGALESLLGCRGGKVQELLRRFYDLFSPSECKLATACKKTERVRKGGVAGAWVADFVVFRHQFAHGRKKAENRPIWRMGEHLLLSSFLLPLLVKLFLEKNGLYTLDDKDQAWIDAFESLASVDLFSRPYQKDFPWTTIMNKPRWGKFMGVAFSEMRKKMVQGMHRMEGGESS